MKVAVAGLLHESNSFAPGATALVDFHPSLARGEDLVKRWGGSRHEIAGFLEGCRREGLASVPVWAATATPGPPVDEPAFAGLVEELLRAVVEAECDGVLLALHGAMVAEGFPDADGEILRRLRGLLPEGIPLVVTLDFHANVSDRMAANCDAILAYQTNPHVDQHAAGVRAAGLMARLLASRKTTRMAVRRPLMLWNILHQNTARPPLSGILQTARQLEEKHGVLAVSVLAGYPYADVEEAGPSVVVVMDQGAGDPALHAAELADRLWNERAKLEIRLPSAAEAVRQACAASAGPVVLVDMGDNIGGGSPGDGTLLLRELLAQEAQGWCVVLHDAASAAACGAAGEGARVRLQVGGRGDPAQGGPVELEGEVIKLSTGKWREPETRHGGVTDWDQGPTALVRTGRDGLLVLTTHRTPPMSLGHITSAGVEPGDRSIITVKAAIAFRAAYEPIAGCIVEVDTPGVTAVNPCHFTYHHLRRPIWPLDVVE